jgi:predicted HD phosphohydrolase
VEAERVNRTLELRLQDEEVALAIAQKVLDSRYMCTYIHTYMYACSYVCVCIYFHLDETPYHFAFALSMKLLNLSDSLLYVKKIAEKEQELQSATEEMKNEKVSSLIL